jgi:UDP-3-O-[3-hydroxymyristoyl] glucosamine N-acyltransferase
MADSRFFNRAGPFAIETLAARIEATVQIGSSGLTPASIFTDVAPLDQAEPDQVSFIDNPKYRDQFKSTRAGACIMRADMVSLAPAHTLCLVTKNPHKSYALAAQLFYPAVRPAPSISPHAVIDGTAQVGQGVRIDAGAVIGAGVTLGDHVWIEANVVIGDQVTIGAGAHIGCGASISHAVIGKNVRLYPGARIGQDGFGFAIDPKGFVKVPQLGRVIIGDHCEIGANTCIDRGAGPDTVIGMGTWIDGLVKIGHNVAIGKGCILAGQVGIAGSTVIEDYVAIGRAGGNFWPSSYRKGGANCRRIGRHYKY